MTNGLGQQQFNLSNLTAREHLLRFRMFVYHRFRGEEQPWIPSAARYVDRFEYNFLRSGHLSWKQSGVFYRFRRGRCFMLPLQKRDSRDISSENSRQGNVARTVLHSSAKFPRSVTALSTSSEFNFHSSCLSHEFILLKLFDTQSLMHLFAFWLGISL